MGVYNKIQHQFFVLKEGSSRGMARRAKRGGMSITGWERPTPTDGEMYEETQILNELPEVGSKVIVMEAVLYDRASNHERVMDFKKAMVADSAYFDAWNRPIIFEVVKYTLGKDRPLDPNNWAILKRTTKSGLEQQILTTQLVSGSMLLYPVDENFVWNGQTKPYK